MCYIKMRYKSRTHQSKEIIMHSKYFRCLHPNTRTPSVLCVISMCIIAFLSVAHANSVRSAACILHQLLACIMEQFIVFVFIRSCGTRQHCHLCAGVFMSAPSKSSSFLQKGSAHLMADADDANCLKYANENTRPLLWLARRRPNAACASGCGAQTI